MATKRAKRTHKIFGSTYVPCDWQDSLDAGARWYRLTRSHFGLFYDERSSPKFATLADCRADALDRRDALDALDALSAE